MKLYRCFPVLMFVMILFMVPARAATITTTSSGGLWREETTWVGGVVPTVSDDVIITSTVKGGNFYYSSGTFRVANMTIKSGGRIVREPEEAGRLLIEVNGKLINHGEVIDNKDFLDFTIRGGLENHGVFRPRIVYMEGAGATISGTEAIACKTFNLNMADDELIAKSDLHFHNCRITYGGSNSGSKLNMGPYSLHLSADVITGSTSFNSACYLSRPVMFDGTGTLILDRAMIGGEITGDVLLKSNSLAIVRDLIINGSLTIEEGSRVNGNQHLAKLRVRGNFHNYGILNADSAVTATTTIHPSTMYLYASGNVANSGRMGNIRLYHVTNGEQLSLKGDFEGEVFLVQSEGNEKPGGSVVIADEVTMHGQLQVNADLEIMQGGVLNLTWQKFNPLYVREVDASIHNHGTIHRYHYVNNSWGYRKFANQQGTFTDIELRDWDARIESLAISVFNNQTYPGLPGSTKRWWRITPIGDGQVKAFTLKLYYDDELLNDQKEENLKVYRSVDEGETWEVISFGEYAVLDTIENSITIGRWDRTESLLDAFGDFVISAGDGSVPVASPIVVDLVGRNDIRLGAPNPYTIHLHNVTDYRVDEFFAAITVTEDIHFKQIEIPIYGGKEIVPIDSIGRPDDHTQVFFVPYLDPNETYSFDVIVVGVNTAKNDLKSNPPSLTATGLRNSAGKSIAQDYLKAKVNEYVDLDEEEAREYARALGLTVEQLKMKKEKQGKGVYAFRTVTKYVVEQASKTNPVTKLIYKIGDTIEHVSDLKDSFRRRIFHWLYKEVGLYGVDEIKVASGKQKEGRMVNSWDPNEKTGPTGFGNLNHKSEAGLMHYTIYFENLKEATAPAYRVQITDTLAGVFDPETVKFGTSSHEGPDYNWVMERNGNILKWDIEGIELPPNVIPPEGEGYVSFSVSLKDGLPSGTSIENRATIIFDINPPITTNTWINVLDMEAPVTTMLPIAYEVGDTLITVSCSSVDNPNGSGVEQYWFYVSENNGPFQLIAETFENNITYPVPDNANNNYRFYAIAIDHVGNMEQHVPAYAEVNSLAVSVNELEDFSHAIQVFPNPSSGTFTVGLNLKESATLQYEVYTVAGQLLHAGMSGPADAGYQSFVVDLNAYKQGVYIARIYINGEATSVRLMKR